MTANRRQFIEKSVAAGALTCISQRCPAQSQSQVDLSSAAVKQLRSQLRGTLILADDPLYETARRVFYWNPRTASTPVAIVQCRHEADAAVAVDFAREHHLEIAVRSGGHSHLAWGCSNGLVIDLSPLNQVSIDPVRGIVRAQGGVLGGDVARAAGAFGLAPVLGQCPGVGAMGVTLGGGLGWLAGLYGACCDNLISVNLINAQGQRLQVDADQEPDLFWALRGAGANFGVATSFEARLHKLDAILGGDVHFAPSDAREVLRGFSRLMRAAPDALQATLNLTPGERGLFISFCHAGDETAADQSLKEIRAWARPTRQLVARQSYATFAQRAAATNPGNSTAPLVRAIHTVYRDEITEEIIEILVDQLAQATPDVVMGLSHYMHGEVCRVPVEATAFPHRRAHSVYLRLALNWSDPSASQQRLQWSDNWLRSLRPATGERIYANYQTYNQMAGTSRTIYAENYQRLLQLKHQHDPDNLFHRNANIA